jgi:hypothetical protein
MDRRELLKMIAVLTGGVVVGGEVFLSGCTNADKKTVITPLTEKDVPYLDEIGDTILPATKTPGAKEAKIGEFMTRIVNDCYDENEQKIFHEGMDKLNEACNKMHGHDFMNATAQQRHELLVSLDNEAKEYGKNRKEFNVKQEESEKQARAKGDTAFKRQEMPKHANYYYTLFKQLTIWGYFTSKEGVTKALRFTPVPGRWDACIDYKKGEAAFAGLD